MYSNRLTFIYILTGKLSIKFYFLKLLNLVNPLKKLKGSRRGYRLCFMLFTLQAINETTLG